MVLEGSNILAPENLFPSIGDQRHRNDPSKRGNVHQGRILIRVLESGTLNPHDDDGVCLLFRRGHRVPYCCALMDPARLCLPLWLTGL